MISEREPNHCGLAVSTELQEGVPPPFAAFDVVHVRMYHHDDL